MIITIDGPAGTGKSTVSRQVAQRLGYDFLDTGAMYRAVALEALRCQVSLDDHDALAAVAGRCQVEFDWAVSPPAVLLNGQPVDRFIRTAESSQAASRIAVVGGVRAVLVEKQKLIGRQRPDLVSEGRDQGTVVFPDAGLKFYLDATPQERARRRVAQLAAKGEVVDYQPTLDDIITRDQRDSSRKVGPLAIPAGAVVIDTTPLTQRQVEDRIVEAAKARGAGK